MLTVRFALADDKIWAPKGHLLAWDQHELPLPAPALPKVDLAAMPPVQLNDGAGRVRVTGEGFEVEIGKSSGAIESYKIGDKNVIARPLVPNFWRAPIDNDEGNQMPKRQGIWWQAGPQRSVQDVRAEKINDKTVRVTARSVLPAGDSDLTNTYTIYGSGDVVVESSFEPKGELPDLPRFGMQMAMPEEFDQVAWYGRGPQESYWDRKTGAAVGVYSGPVSEQVHIYVRPQETGNKEDVRWFAVTNSDGMGLVAVGMPLLSASAWPFSMDELQAARHTNDLWTATRTAGERRQQLTTVNLDYKQMGLGGDNSWGARTHEEYTLPAKPYSYSFRLSPLHGTSDKPADRAKLDFD